MSKKKIIIVGYKSFIQENLYKNLLPRFNVKKIKFKNLKKKKIKNTIVINCSQHDRFFNKRYNRKFDRNLIIANYISNSDNNLIILSTRQVYKPKIGITESSAIKPINTYAKNCIKSEKYCNKRLNRQLLILRLSNVIGNEIGKKKRPSIMSLIIKGKENKRLIFDNNIFLYKDFLPINLFCRYISKILTKKMSGIYNVGSGIPIKVKNFVENIIDTKKVNINIIKKKKFIDADFSFNISKLQKAIKIKVNKKYLNNELIKLKKQIN